MVNSVVTEISVGIPITKERLSDLLCDAFEGGSNYWYFIDEFIKPPVLEFKTDKKVIFRHLDYPLNDGGALLISDQEDDRKKQYRLDLESIKKGIQIMAEKYPWEFGNFINDNDDANTGDTFLQCCLFGDVIYG
jgi:hypothetical protein